MDILDGGVKVFFVSSSGKVHKRIPFIESQYESLKPWVKKIDRYRVNGGIKSYFSAYGELKEKLRNEDYDIVHAHWVYSGILSALLVNREKLVISFMGNDLMGFYSKKHNVITPKGILNIILSQLLMLKVDAVIVKSKRMMTWVPRLFRKKATILPNGVNLKKFKIRNQAEARYYLGLDYNARYVLFLGNTTDHNKNFQLLRKAAEMLAVEKIKFQILSPYPVEPDMVPHYLAAANVLAFPSKMEGSPNLVKEAMVMRCPIVSTDVGDVVERIGRIKGCFISSFDEEDFANKLRAALDFGGRIELNGETKEISEEAIAKRLVNLYGKLLTEA